MLAFVLSIAFAWDPSEVRVIEALSVRHDPPSCAELRAVLARPAESLIAIAEQIEGPPWVGMRAADCVATLPEAAPALRRWVIDPKLAGLADVVLQRLDSLPEAVAVPIARDALRGPLADLARRRLVISSHAAVRALTGG